MRRAAGFRIGRVGTGMNRDAESVKKGEGTSCMFPNNHTCSTYLELFKTSTIEVNDKIMLFYVGIAYK